MVYLAGEATDRLTGRVIGAHACHVTLFSRPAVVADLALPVPWEVDRACEGMEHTFRTALRGDPSIPSLLGR
jgi:hypothetical protein